ncbi:mycofactocin system glycosyltransferase [Nakamurella sp. YIM 132087]|uniref:Mycofactocin system glycosyltransferase n=1 Tax=Nakamurella alba TaxID=2665158 RepID=A0A7K1FN30_9ACTN|nr:mycofactocin biosynthesis glycosyltransferase MftF [Nakamurella alba]MTD15490.1 mycofactocin system glycosyltransferase [Nakamurella alba]
MTSTWSLTPGTRWLDRHTLAGGAPYRLITLTPTGSGLLREKVLDRPGHDLPAAMTEVLRRLETAGLVQAPTPPAAGHHDVTLVIPARSHPDPLRALLARLPADLPVTIVDDGSPTPLAVLADQRPHTTVLRHETSRGPAAARNAGAALVTTGWIGFLDADTLPDPDWIDRLLGHIQHTDQTGAGKVVLAAPRIHALPGTGTSAWFEQQVCALDLGGTPSDVGIGLPVSYVPSAALLVATDAFRAVGGFDEDMHVGEDVDLVWRLATHGRIRYLPDIAVAHRPRGTLTAALARRVDYGRSAADLGRRHPGALRHVDISAWSFAPWAAAILIHPAAGAALAAATTAIAIAPWGMPDLSPAHARRLAATGHLRAAGALGRWLIRPLWPLTAAVALAHPRTGGRLALAAAAGLAYLTSLEIREKRPLTHIPGSLLARTLDDLAYSIGVWHGAVQQRTTEPLRPRIRDLPRIGRWRRA